MTRKALIEDLQDYQATEVERPHIDRFLSLLDGREDCFFRSCFEPGHVTGSALLVGPNYDKVLLNHHKIFNRWMNFGGHADGDEDIRRVAIRETFEESGIENVALLEHGFFDIDIHPIGANLTKNEPPHFHFDIVFLLRAPHEDFVISHESNDLKWCGYEEAMSLCRADGSLRMMRILEKWKAWQG